MYTALIVLIVIAAVLLVLIVLVQNSKGGGLAVGGGAQYGGVAEQKSKLENYTWWLVGLIAFFSIIASISGGQKPQDNQQSGVSNYLNQNVTPNPVSPVQQAEPANVEAQPAN